MNQRIEELATPLKTQSDSVKEVEMNITFWSDANIVSFETLDEVTKLKIV